MVLRQEEPRVGLHRGPGMPGGQPTAVQGSE